MWYGILAGTIGATKDLANYAAYGQPCSRFWNICARYWKWHWPAPRWSRSNVYEIARRCGTGTPNCICTRGRFYRNIVLTWSEQGGSHRRSIPRARVAEVRQKSAEYLRLRRARAEVSVLDKKILKVLDQIQELRREAPQMTELECRHRPPCCSSATMRRCSKRFVAASSITSMPSAKSAKPTSSEYFIVQSASRSGHRRSSPTGGRSERSGCCWQ